MIEIDEALAQEAFEEALRRFPEATSALIFLWGASGLGAGKPRRNNLSGRDRRWRREEEIK